MEYWKRGDALPAYYKKEKKNKAASLQAGGPALKESGCKQVDSLQAIGYYKIMNKKYWLLDYFTRPNNELSKYYIKKVEKFLKCLKKKPKK